MEKECFGLVAATYSSAYCQTASVNHKPQHKLSLVHGLTNCVRQELAKNGARGPTVESADGEFAPWYHDLNATRPSVMKACANLASKEKKEPVILVSQIISLSKSRFVFNVCICTVSACKLNMKIQRFQQYLFSCATQSEEFTFIFAVCQSNMSAFMHTCC
jgi:hypothetical protein